MTEFLSRLNSAGSVSPRNATTQFVGQSFHDDRGPCQRHRPMRSLTIQKSAPGSVGAEDGGHGKNRVRSVCPGVPQATGTGTGPFRHWTPLRSDPAVKSCLPPRGASSLVFRLRLTSHWPSERRLPKGGEGGRYVRRGGAAGSLRRRKKKRITLSSGDLRSDRTPDSATYALFERACQ